MSGDEGGACRSGDLDRRGLRGPCGLFHTVTYLVQVALWEFAHPAKI